MAKLATVGDQLDTHSVAIGSIGLPDSRLGGDEARFTTQESRKAFWEEAMRLRDLFKSIPIHFLHTQRFPPRRAAPFASRKDLCPPF